VTSFLVVLAVTHGDGVLRRWVAWRPWRYLGNISYSFYLVHGLGIELAMNVHRSGGAGLGGPIYLVTTLVSSLVIGLALATVLFLVAEKPYFTWRRAGAAAVSDGYGGTSTAPAR